MKSDCFMEGNVRISFVDDAPVEWTGVGVYKEDGFFFLFATEDGHTVAAYNADYVTGIENIADMDDEEVEAEEESEE